MLSHGPPSRARSAPTLAALEPPERDLDPTGRAKTQPGRAEVGSLAARGRFDSVSLRARGPLSFSAPIPERLAQAEVYAVANVRRANSASAPVTPVSSHFSINERASASPTPRSITGNE